MLAGPRQPNVLNAPEILHLVPKVFGSSQTTWLIKETFNG